MPHNRLSMLSITRPLFHGGTVCFMEQMQTELPSGTAGWWQINDLFHSKAANCNNTGEGE